ncbi:hypothetical protein BCR44DRAFT_48180 [Catenaria anguillulae PL171]|uniref:VPS4-associated protein 1 n=1 Tax=Catenaria anguillulae PL171 TaxID=765915 RepID=A0A1Y2HZY6_9FUNG|nr:hypothetical protein BCR44DRAFT_48180 [Catenaria anguillulae PL171]
MASQSQGALASKGGSANKLPFLNAYKHHVATSDRACWMCGKLTTNVLTCQDIDFFYICANHIKDAGFCRPLAVPAATAVATTDGTAPKTPAAASAELKPGGTYELHSRVFGMREQKYRDKQREATKAKVVASLPSVPAKALPPKR